MKNQQFNPENNSNLNNSSSKLVSNSYPKQKNIRKKKLNLWEYFRYMLYFPNKKQNFFARVKAKYNKLLNIDYYLRLHFKVKEKSFTGMKGSTYNNYIDDQNDSKQDNVLKKQDKNTMNEMQNYQN